MKSESNITSLKYDQYWNQCLQHFHSRRSNSYVRGIRAFCSVGILTWHQCNGIFSLKSSPVVLSNIYVWTSPFMGTFEPVPWKKTSKTWSYLKKKPKSPARSLISTNGKIIHLQFLPQKFISETAVHSFSKLLEGTFLSSGSEFPVFWTPLSTGIF